MTVQSLVEGYLDLALAKFADHLQSLGDDLVNTAPDLPGANTAYALAAHCAGVIRYWGTEVIAGRPVLRDRDAELTSAGTVSEALALLRDARAELSASLAGFDADAPVRGRLRDRDRDRALVQTQGGALLHIYEELSQHLGHLDLTVDLVRSNAS